MLGEGANGPARKLDGHKILGHHRRMVTGEEEVRFGAIHGAVGVDQVRRIVVWRDGASSVKQRGRREAWERGSNEVQGWPNISSLKYA